ncbi:MAG: hypothetical protein K9I36_16690 [Bacteroidia bacterium]|nr:hypothetical protein [Bacteroidia bacterium]
METILYSHSGGEGIILENDAPLLVRKENPFVAGEILIPGTSTSMSGYFKHSLEFCGVINENDLVFFIGEDSDLLGSKRYYQVVHLISENRLFSMFSHGAGRDFNFINGKWK